MSKIVGIDLGTTNSLISVVEGGVPTVIPSAEGDFLFPSVVGFSRTRIFDIIFTRIFLFVQGILRE